MLVTNTCALFLNVCVHGAVYMPYLTGTSCGLQRNVVNRTAMTMLALSTQSVQQLLPVHQLLLHPVILHLWCLKRWSLT
jgi:hypothetical protein